MQSFEDEEKPESFLLRHRIKLITAAVVAGIAVFLASVRVPEPRRAVPANMVRITSIQPPTQPPPRPPEPQPKPENVPPTPREMVMQEPVASDEPLPSEAPPAESSEAAPGPAGEAMGTNIQGDGSPNAFGLVGRGGGGLLGGGGGGGGGHGGSRWGWYASQMQSQIERALRDHEKTRVAGLRINVRLWADRTGRITRAQLAGSTGDAGLDAVIKNEVLTGLHLKEPPPADMPQPIVMRITAVRSH